MLISPEFEIDKYNRVLCKDHDNYLKFIKVDLDFFDNFLIEKELTCLTCIHYKYDECYFKKQKIKEIEVKRQKKKYFTCQLCGKRIERIFNILYSLYYKEKFNIEIPLICCSCYDLLDNKEFLSQSKKIIYFHLFVIISSVYFLFYSNFIMEIFNFAPLIKLLINFLIMLTMIAIMAKSLNKIKWRRKGRRFVKERQL